MSKSISVFSLTSITLSTIFGVVCAGYQNVLDGPLHFVCGAHQSISRFHSVDDNHANDRQFELACSNVNASGSLPEKCQWTAQYVNNFDEVIAFQCPQNGYITGIDSYHDNSYEDRRFKFRCCETTGLHTEDCDFTGALNKYDAPVDYYVPSGRVLRGVISTHSNHYEDRVWNFDICHLYEHREETEVIGK